MSIEGAWRSDGRQVWAHLGDPDGQLVWLPDGGAHSPVAEDERSSQADPELLAHQLVAALWESGRLRLVSPKKFTHDRLLRSLDAMFAATGQPAQAAL